MWQAFKRNVGRRRDDAALAGMDYFLLGKGALLVRERSLVSSALQAWASVSSGASLEASFDDDDGDGAYVFSEPSDAEEEEDVGSLAATISDATAARLAATLNRLSPASSDANDARSTSMLSSKRTRLGAVNAPRGLGNGGGAGVCSGARAARPWATSTMFVFGRFLQCGLLRGGLQRARRFGRLLAAAMVQRPKRWWQRVSR